MDVIRTESLSRSFGAVSAVRDVNLVVPAGAVYGFLGPNGSGKTTTIRILLGLLRADKGNVSILGRSMPRERLVIARSVGSMVETPSLYDHLTGFENVDLTRRVLGLPRTETDRVIALVGLSADAQRRAGAYSLGMRQRLAIARALLGGPAVLILDEPMNGLDPAGVREMRGLIRGLPDAAGVTVFLSSHLLAEVEHVASHVGLMFGGALVAQSSLPDLLRSVPATLVVEVGDAAHAAAHLRNLGLRCDLAGPGRITTPLDQIASPGAAEVNRILVAEGFSVASLQTQTPSLEDIFLDRTAGRAAMTEAHDARPHMQ